MNKIELKRSGLRPLAFSGKLLASSDGFRLGGKDHSRWHEIVVYRTAEGRYVVGVKLGTRYQGELDHYAAEVTADPAAVECFLLGYDPCPDGIGYPPGDAYAERQARIIADLRRRYEAQVTELFDALGAEFREQTV